MPETGFTRLFVSDTVSDTDRYGGDLEEDELCCEEECDCCAIEDGFEDDESPRTTNIREIIRDEIHRSMGEFRPDPEPDTSPPEQNWDEALSFATGEVVKYTGPNLEIGTLFVIYGVKCIGEATGEPIYYVKYYEGGRERYGHGIHHRYLKSAKKEAKVDWEV
jgi:hypothetical protein